MLDDIDHRRLLDDDAPTVEAFLDGLERLAMRIACRRYRFRREDAEDVALDVARRLWEDDRAALRAWRGEGSLSAYLSSIVHRSCLMELRRRGRRPATVGDERLDERPAATLPDPTELDELIESCRRATAELTERDRRLIQLRFIEERDYETITAELRISYGAARKAVHSALTRLRERMRRSSPELFPISGAER